MMRPPPVSPLFPSPPLWRSPDQPLAQSVSYGARRADIPRMIVGLGLRLSLAGIVLGSLAAAVLTGLMEGTLFRVSATGPAAFEIGRASCRERVSISVVAVSLKK